MEKESITYIIHGNMEKQRIKTDYTDFHGLFYLPIESGRNL